jgi:predicted N-acetyltransferase YhbS
MKCTCARTRVMENAYAEVIGKAFKRYHADDYRERSRNARSSQRYERILLDDDGKVVAGVLVVAYDLRYGDTTITAGGIADVVTDPECQGEGHGRMLFENVQEFMEDEGFHVSELFGIPNYYHKFYYVSALTWQYFMLNVLGLRVESDPKTTSRLATVEDIPLLSGLYDADKGRYPLSMVRNESDWLWLFEHQGFTNKCHLIEREGAPVTYYVFDSPKSWVEEICMVEGTPKELYDGILAEICAEAKKDFKLNLHVDLPADDPLAKHCLLRHEVPWMLKADNNRGAMFRIVNQGPLFGQIAGELEKNWIDRPRSVSPTSFTLRTPLGDVGFDASESALRVTPGHEIGEVVELPSEAVTELVCAFRAPADVLADAGLVGSSESADMICAVFPDRITFQSHADHF